MLVESAFGAIWEDPEGGFIKFMVKRASKQDQTLHMEGKLHVILYFREECHQKTCPFSGFQIISERETIVFL